MTTSLKICTIGCGAFSRGIHGPSLRKYAAAYPGTILAGCCDLDPHKASAFARDFGYRNHYTDWTAMLEKERPDAINLLVPPPLTAQLSCDIIARGIPVIMEKPPGLNTAECRMICLAASAARVPAMVAFNRRHTPLSEYAKQQIARIPPHEAQCLRCTFRRVQRYDSDFATTIIHAVDTVRYLAGSDYQELEFAYDSIAHGKARNFRITGAMVSGLRVVIEVFPACGINCELYEFMAFNRILTLDLSDTRVGFLHTGDNKVVEKLDKTTGEKFIDGGFYRENEVFFNAVRSESTHPGCTVADALQSVIVADCLRRGVPEYHLQL